MKTTKEKIEIMQAWEDGLTVENRGVDYSGRWVSLAHEGEPQWNWQLYDYRIKPEPKVIWVNEFDVAEYAYSSEDIARREAVEMSCPADRIAVKYIEVLEDES